MGKGDKKSRKGKIAMGSYGNTRPQFTKKSTATTTTTQPADASKNAAA